MILQFFFFRKYFEVVIFLKFEMPSGRVWEFAQVH